jgi:hypothetical protein
MALAAAAVLIATAAAANLAGPEAANMDPSLLAPDFSLQTEPAAQDVCKPNDAVYEVEVQAVDGFTDTVSLNLAGEPASTSFGFVPDSAEAPFTSTLTITNTELATAGSYQLVITGTWMTATHTTTATLDLFDPPGTTTLTSPADEATDVALQPLLDWEADPDTITYTLEVDDNNDFGSITYSAVVTDATEHAVAVELQAATEYFWRVRGTNSNCGDGNDSAVYSFTTSPVPSIDTSPDAMDESLVAGGAVTNTLTITNVGTGNLDWTIEESASGSCPASLGIDWITLSDTSGSAGTGQSDEVDVVFDTTGLATGDYSGALCINSNDATTPVVTLPLDLSVTDFSVTADPDSQSVCKPNDAIYTVDVGSVNGFADAVLLSLTGNPSGSSVDFTANSINAPFTSTLTIGSTGAASVGDYDMVITGFFAPASHTTTVHLELRGAPPPVTLSSPPDNATGAPLKPLLDWNAGVDVVNYTVQLASDDGFSNIIFAETTTDTEAKVDDYLEPETEYFWRVRADNDCGQGTYSAVWSFTTKPAPAILLVDDDNNAPDVQPIYTAALDSLVSGSYDVWDTEVSDNEPSASFLSHYDVVIWFTGAGIYAPTGPSPASEAALGTWLDGGGCFLMSSQDYNFAREINGEPTPFMMNYLGVESVEDDQGMSVLRGAGFVYGELGPYDTDYDSLFNDYSDVIYVGDTAEVAFEGTFMGSGYRPGGVNNLGATYATTYLAFPWEAIELSADREEVLTTFYDWCDSRTAWYDVFIPMLQGD